MDVLVRALRLLHGLPVQLLRRMPTGGNRVTFDPWRAVVLVFAAIGAATVATVAVAVLGGLLGGGGA